MGCYVWYSEEGTESPIRFYVENKNLAIDNRSRVSCAHNTLRAYRHKYYTVTLKSRLRVTQGLWKRNHWIDHTRLSSIVELFDVEYYRDLEMWVRGH